MSYANVKISSSQIDELKRLTGEKTGQKAVYLALLYFLRQAKQRQVLKVLENINFDKK